MSESKTPRTDALQAEFNEDWRKPLTESAAASLAARHADKAIDFARQLERDLAQVREEREHDREEFDARDADRVRKWATAEAKQRQRAEAAEQFISRLTSELEAARACIRDADKQIVGGSAVWWRKEHAPRNLGSIRARRRCGE